MTSRLMNFGYSTQRLTNSSWTLLVSGRFELRTSRRVLLASVVFIGVVEALYVCSSKAVVSAVGALLWGIGAAVFGPVCRASLLESVSDEQHGEVMAAWRSVQSAGSLVLPLVVGAIGQWVGTQLTMIGTSVMVVITGLIMWQVLVRRRRSQITHGHGVG
jgi:sugar phosphate permease